MTTTDDIRSLTATATRRPQSGEGSFGGGLCQEWISGGNDKVQFELTSGAGLGNSLLSLHVTFPDGESLYEDVSMAALVTQWVESIMAERQSQLIDESHDVSGAEQC